MSSYRIGMNLRVTEDSNQGGRRYMEDRHAIRFVKNDEGGFEFAYFGIFDGHGGGEASKYARDHLLDEITKFDCFWSDNDDDILYAIRSAFLDTHLGMWKEVDKWPTTPTGLPSTAGTTASICIIKNSKLYIGHVGDSGIVLGYNENRTTGKTCAKTLTKEHKPDDPQEKERIEGSGGQVIAKSGVQRVVWNRPRTSHKGPIRRSTPIDKIPFLAVARSLGDLWSYNYLKEEFVVSPEPDVSVHKLDPSTDKCLVIGSDGLWNMLSSEESVAMVDNLEQQFENKVINDPTVPVSYWINPAERLVQAALAKWRMRMMKADNTSAIVVLIDPLGPRKLAILKKKREERMREVAENRVMDNRLATEMLTARESLQKSPKKQKDKSVKSPEVPESTTPIPVVGEGQVVWNESLVTNMLNRAKPGEALTAMPATVKSSHQENLDDSVQLRHSHRSTGSAAKHGDGTTSGKSTPSPSKTKTSPLQTSTSENCGKTTGMVTRSSPQKSPVRLSPANAPSHEIRAKKDASSGSVPQSKSTLLSQSAVNGQHKCSDMSKHRPDSASIASKIMVNKVKDLENIFSTDVKLRMKNLNINRVTKVKQANLNNSNSSEILKSSKKSKKTKSLSSRISLRLRRLRQRTQQRSKTVNKPENKAFVAKAGVKRKLDSSASSSAVKKVRHY